MNCGNLINEGFFDKLKKILGLSPAQEKQLKKNKAVASKIKDIIDDLNHDVKDFENFIDDYYKELGINKKADIRKYKITDFLK
mgnify:CR=1 FL=1